jgi:hypothetical protein
MLCSATKSSGKASRPCLRCAHCPRHCSRTARSPVQICKKSELLAGRASRVAMWPKSPRSYSADRSELAFFQAMTPGEAYSLHPARIRVRRGRNGRRPPRPHKSFVGIRGALRPAHWRFESHRKVEGSMNSCNSSLKKAASGRIGDHAGRHRVIRSRS